MVAWSPCQGAGHGRLVPPRCSALEPRCVQENLRISGSRAACPQERIRELEAVAASLALQLDEARARQVRQPAGGAWLFYYIPTPCRHTAGSC